MAALSLADDGSKTFEIGCPQTGATCLLVDDPEGWRLILPLIRTPTSARDLLPPVAAQVPLGLEAPLAVDALLALWEQRHREACQELMAVCAAQGSPPPPHLPRAELERLHGWLWALHGRDDIAGPILAVDFQSGEAVTLAVALPPSGTVPPVPAVFAAVGVPGMDNVGGETRLFVLEPDDPREAALLRARLAERPGFSLARARIVSPVEIVDSEALGG